MVTKKQKQNRYKGWLVDYICMWFYLISFLGFGFGGWTVLCFHDFLLGIFMIFLSLLSFMGYIGFSLIIRTMVVNKKVDLILEKL